MTLRPISVKPNRRFPSIPNVAGDIRNHTEVLAAIKEAVEVGKRDTADILNSYVRVKDLVDMGFATLKSGLLVPEEFATGGGGDTDDQTASEVPYSNGTSGLYADNVQEAIDELAASLGGGTDDQVASEVPFSSTGMLTEETDVQAVLAQIMDPRNYFWYFSDLLGPAGLEFRADVSVAGTVNFISEVGRPGIVEISTSSSTGTSNGFLRATNALTGVGRPALLASGGELVFESAIRIDSLWGGSNTGQIRLGFMNEISGAPSVGVHLQYQSGTSAWVLFARNSSGSSSDSSGAVTVTTGWHRIKIVINADGTSASLYVDGALAATVSANIPVADGFSFGAQIQKTGGTTAMTCAVDYIHVRQKFTSARV